MTDPVSVILIVGAAVVGPVVMERTCVTTNCDVATELMGGCHPVACKTSETVAQTCERAMKEIGAKWIGGQLWVVQGRDALCIPAPKGLK